MPFPLVWQGFISSHKFTSQLELGDVIDHKAKGHDRHEGLDSFRGFEEQSVCHKPGVLQESEASFNRLLIFVATDDFCWIKA